MRLLIVSNRLPIVAAEEDGQIVFKEAAGGLVSGLSAYLDSLKGSAFTKSDYVWVGWPGATIDAEKQDALKTHALEFNAYPVFLNAEAMDKFYHGFCNKTIWPLFHYFPSYMICNQDYWNEYAQVNRTFCDTILEILKPGDVVWIHDYHLMLLPQMLKERVPNIPLGFFLHIPFPSYEVFRLLPKTWRREILLGLLGADLIGFHTHDYTEYFLRCVLRILGYEHHMGKIIVNGRIKKAETFPMGIDFEKFQNTARSSEAQKSKTSIQKTFPEQKIILSVDRLDYTKGVIKRLQGFELFLEKNPAWHEKVMLSIVLVPSRVGVEHYQETKTQIDELVGKINGRFGTINWIPIVYQYRYLPLAPLVALYAASDIALITPLRDGMNLVAKEYIATRTDQTGVLILSEMVGAAKELGEALIVNPNHVEDIAHAIKDALEMPKEEQIRRNKIMQTRLKRYNVMRWADDFVQTLISLLGEQEKFDAKHMGYSTTQQLVDDFNRAQHRLFVLDYDGTLSPLLERPQLAKPSKELAQILAALADDPKNEIVLTSGRDKSTLENWFGALRINLIAEHGVWIKEGHADWRMFKPLRNDWKAQLLPILELHADRVPGSFVEEKEFSLAWHYRKADSTLGAMRAKELMDDLVHFTANADIQVLSGSKVVELRNLDVSKGASIMQWLAHDNVDFILAAGNDWADEDIFKVLPPSAYSIKVGITPSHAKFSLHNPVEMVRLLSDLAGIRSHSYAATPLQTLWEMIATWILE